MPNLLKVRLSLKGRPIRTYLFDKPSVTIGRNPDADIFLDNTGISRDHALIERTPGGYQICDLGSANGTYLNEQPVRKDYLGEDDVVQIGKFALWMAIEGERREHGSLLGAASPAAFEGTMVLDPDSLKDMQRKSSVEVTESGPVPAAAEPRTRLRGTMIHAAVFLAGGIAGWALSLLARG
ncbi:FHA domain-containing protein [bacterium]|nr:FHA domain-containing protein [bacterium]